MYLHITNQNQAEPSKTKQTQPEANRIKIKTDHNKIKIRDRNNMCTSVIFLGVPLHPHPAPTRRACEPKRLGGVLHGLGQIANCLAATPQTNHQRTSNQQAHSRRQARSRPKTIPRNPKAIQPTAAFGELVGSGIDRQISMRLEAAFSLCISADVMEYCGMVPSDVGDKHKICAYKNSQIFAF